MTQWRKYFDTKFLNGYDIERDKEVKLTIVDVREEMVKGATGTDKKLSLIFKETKKMMVLNVSNSKRLTKLSGSLDIKNWIGLEIVLHIEGIKYKSDPDYPGLRIMIPKSKPLNP